MKFTVNSKSLLNCLVASGKAISNRPHVAILSCFLLNLKDDMLTLTASDSEITVTSAIKVSDAEGSGQICIAAKRLIDLLKIMPDCQVIFEVKDLHIVIRYTSGKYNLTGQPGAEYPLDERLDDKNTKGTLFLSASQILSAIDKVGFAVANDQLRPQLNGIFWDITEEAITWVATDTHVLAKYRSTQTAPNVSMSFVLPGRSLPLIRAFINKQTEVQLTVTDRFVILKGEEYKIRITLVKGNFPNYNRVIPSSRPIVITVERTDFLDAVSRVAVCADSPGSVLRLRIRPGQLEALVRDMLSGTGAEERVACEYIGQEMEIGFNSSYLKEMADVLSSRKIIIALSAPDRPVLLLPAENEPYGELTLLCMPMMIPD